MKNRIKYVGGWSANNGSTYASNYTFTTLQEARKTLREIVKGNVFIGEKGYWQIYKTDSNGQTDERSILSGVVRK